MKKWLIGAALFLLRIEVLSLALLLVLVTAGAYKLLKVAADGGIFS